MDGVQLCARFSIATSRLQFCGPAGADQSLYASITGPRGLESTRQALRRFEALMPYLELIAGKHHLDPFDYRVVEAYWIGNPLLDAFDRRDFETLVQQLVRRGLPRSIADQLSAHLPDRALPHHAFHVSFVGVGNVTGHVETNLPNMESCRPGFGKVRSVDGSAVTYAGPTLVQSGLQLALGPERNWTIPYDAQVVPGLTRGEAIATHWGTVAVRLEPAQLAALRHYTAVSLGAASEGLAAMAAGRAAAAAD